MDKNSLNLIAIGLGILILFSFYTSKNENWQNDDVSWSQNNKKEEIKEEVEELKEEPKEEIVSPPEEIKSNVCNCGCGKEFCNCKKRRTNTNCESGSCNSYQIMQPSCNSYQGFYSNTGCGISQDCYGYTEININPYCNNN